MAWRDTTEEQEERSRGKGRWFAPGSSGWEAFGARWDQADKEGIAFGLSAPQVLAAGRQGMSLREYAAFSGVRTIDEYTQHVENESVLRQALTELSVERAKDELRGAS